MRPVQRPGGAQQIPRPDHFTEHFDAPWPLDATWSVDELLAPVRPPVGAAVASSFGDDAGGWRNSAVLITLAERDDGGADVLLTRRSMDMSSHRGEISFPGGRADAGETAEQTALREAHEEIGLEPDAVTVVGELEHFSTIVSNSYIVPVVARLDAAPDQRPLLSPQTMEADRVMWTPISELTRPGTYRHERWQRDGDQLGLHFFELDDETIWGVTALMLHELLVAAAGETREGSR